MTVDSRQDRSKSYKSTGKKAPESVVWINKQQSSGVVGEARWRLETMLAVRVLRSAARILCLGWHLSSLCMYVYVSKAAMPIGQYLSISPLTLVGKATILTWLLLNGALAAELLSDATFSQHTIHTRHRSSRVGPNRADCDEQLLSIPRSIRTFKQRQLLPRTKSALMIASCPEYFQSQT